MHMATTQLDAWQPTTPALLVRNPAANASDCCTCDLCCGFSTDKVCALQDLDIDFQLVLNAATYDQLMGQLGRDCALLESLRVMDYSLLLGVHYLSWGADEWIAPQIKVGTTKPGSAYAIHPDHACCELDQVVGFGCNDVDLKELMEQ